jgi:uncharacterized protein YkwD
MTNDEKQGFWRNYGLSIFLVAVIFIVVIFVKMRPSVDQSETGNNPVSQKAEVSASSPAYAVPGEILNRSDIIILTNNARSQNGLPPLKENQLLDKIAESRAQDMLDKQYFAHVSPTGQQASDIAQQVGYHYKIIAENIGSGDFYTNQKIIDGWMQSPGHRGNILSTEVGEIGAAVLKGKMKGTETYIAVQIFGLESPPVSQKICVAPSKNLLDEINQKKAEIDSLRDQLDRLRNEIEEQKESMERNRKHAEGDNEKIRKLNADVSAYNEKIGWYGRSLEEFNAKTSVARSMINEYNKMMQAYNECEASH